MWLLNLVIKLVIVAFVATVGVLLASRFPDHYILPLFIGMGIGYIAGKSDSV